MANSYDIPSWAGKPPTGLHLDVLKDEKLVQKLMVDEKRCYLFGRNSQMNDFCIDHASCSRVHAAFVYHKHLNIAYLVDLGSTHGTFIGTLRLEAHKPTQLQINSTFHFGASTRNYILRERPSGHHSNIMEDLPLSETSDGALLGLPESQTELDNLTEYNTAHNRRISMLGIDDDTNMRKQNALKQGRRSRNVTFNDEEIIINPEDVDPNVGRFRNLVQTTVVPAKRARFDVNHMGIHSGSSLASANAAHVHQLFQQSLADMKHQHQHNREMPPPHTVPHSPTNSLYQGIPAEAHGKGELEPISPLSIGSKLGLLLPNPAPEVLPIFDEALEPTSSLAQKLAVANANVRRYVEDPHDSSGEGDALCPQKKKYAKEAWPGRKPMLGQL
ncbi:nuclear inhibitor of protein phosphatase 1 [Drosophila kikkawai]|uniref:Nuclear inhibitor of protein phosphatase 1 n=1 Tax=Drosophila kikkawai TaxID=30033 RepID=A0A6P4IQ12_DROKI|nr:nuclear inhibitor of protein phosphatase 1 [Drosophila kikkawai]XP_017024907.1 nuclear inhibitor of protein phosphatase 1 [Drosophila kikkawai]